MKTKRVCLFSYQRRSFSSSLLMTQRNFAAASLCLHLADPATFLAAQCFPLRTACLLSHVKHKSPWVCTVTSLILQILWSELRDAPLRGDFLHTETVMEGLFFFLCRRHVWIITYTRLERTWRYFCISIWVMTPAPMVSISGCSWRKDTWAAAVRKKSFNLISNNHLPSSSEGRWAQWNPAAQSPGCKIWMSTATHCRTRQRAASVLSSSRRASEAHLPPLQEKVHAVVHLYTCKIGAVTIMQMTDFCGF